MYENATGKKVKWKYGGKDCKILHKRKTRRLKMLLYLNAKVIIDVLEILQQGNVEEAGFSGKKEKSIGCQLLYIKGGSW